MSAKQGPDAPPLACLDAPVRRVIWDWNGTLFNDAWLCMDVMNSLLSEHQLPLLTLDRYQRLFDFPVIDYYRRLGFDFEAAPFETVGSEFIRRYENRRLECDLHDGAMQLLEHFREQGIPQTVLSAYEQTTLLSLLRHFDIDHFFDEIIGNDDHYAAGKEEKALAWIARLNEPPESALLIGDTLHDADVAASMGVQCVLVAGGNQHEDRLRSRAVPLFDSLRKLADSWQSSGDGVL